MSTSPAIHGESVTPEIIELMNLVSPGYYYHYKHDPSLGVYHHAYQVISYSIHTETNQWLVIYKPLDPSYEFPDIAMVRPLTMFAEDRMVDGNLIRRFQAIVEPRIIELLSQITCKS